MVFDQPGFIGWGSNGGFQAINIAVVFGATTIALVGFDMSLQRGIHWHGRHPPGLNNPKQGSIDKWRAELDAEAPALAARGVDVVLCSPHSSLTGYRRADLLETI